MEDKRGGLRPAVDINGLIKKKKEELNMSKRSVQNQDCETPQKKTKVIHDEIKPETPKKEETTTQKTKVIPEEKTQIIKPETPRKEETTTKNIESPSTSQMTDDRYSFNYWGNSETNSVAEPKKEISKIGDLKFDQNENKSLVVRITYKSELKDTKFGKVVSCLVLDDTGEIALVCFGKLALDVYKNWEYNHVYCIKNFNIQKENENYPSGSNNPLQLKAKQNFMYTKIDNSDCPSIPFSFKSIEEIKSSKINTRVDLLGILLKDYGLESNANNVSMRDILLTDNEKGMIIATLWGTAAEKFKSIINSTIVIRKGVVGLYKDKYKINCTIGTIIWLNPPIPEASPLLLWFHENNQRMESK